jgi:hypothetical protein
VTVSPAAPANLTASANGSGEIDLAWQPASALTLLTTGVQGNAFSDSGLAPGTTYYYQEAVADRSGVTASGLSSGASATTAFANPSVTVPPLQTIFGLPFSQTVATFIGSGSGTRSSD